MVTLQAGLSELPVGTFFFINSGPHPNPAALGEANVEYYTHSLVGAFTLSSPRV